MNTRVRPKPNKQLSDKPNILFIDDEKRVLNSMRALFRRDYNLFLTTSGDDALKIIDQNDIDVVVADQRMPVMTGVEVLSQVKVSSPSTIRILLTGYANMRAIESAMNDGEVFRFLTKPCAVDELRGTIREAADIACTTSTQLRKLADPEPTGKHFYETMAKSREKASLADRLHNLMMRKNKRDDESNDEEAILSASEIQPEAPPATKQETDEHVLQGRIYNSTVNSTDAQDESVDNLDATSIVAALDLTTVDQDRSYDKSNPSQANSLLAPVEDPELTMSAKQIDSLSIPVEPTASEIDSSTSQYLKLEEPTQETQSLSQAQTAPEESPVEAKLRRALEHLRPAAKLAHKAQQSGEENVQKTTNDTPSTAKSSQLNANSSKVDSNLGIDMSAIKDKASAEKNDNETDTDATQINLSPSAMFPSETSKLNDKSDKASVNSNSNEQNGVLESNVTNPEVDKTSTNLTPLVDEKAAKSNGEKPTDRLDDSTTQAPIIPGRIHRVMKHPTSIDVVLEGDSIQSTEQEDDLEVTLGGRKHKIIDLNDSIEIVLSGDTHEERQTDQPSETNLPGTITPMNAASAVESKKSNSSNTAAAATLSDETIQQNRSPRTNGERVSMRVVGTGKYKVSVVVFTTDAAFAQFVGKSLQGFFYTFHAASTEQLMHAIRSVDPAVLITDISTEPEFMQQLTAKLKQKVPELVTMVASQHRDAELMVKLINHGQVFRIVDKPMSTTACKIYVREALKKHVNLRRNPELIHQHRVAVSRNDSKLPANIHRLMSGLGRVRSMLGGRAH